MPRELLMGIDIGTQSTRAWRCWIWPAMWWPATVTPTT